jgi:nicotinate phosphoribosyltransferase
MKFAPMQTRLESHVFDLPVQELRRGYRSDVYFWREKIALEQHGLHPVATMQVFQKHTAVLCGIDEALAALKLASGRYTDYGAACRLFDRYMDLQRMARVRFLSDKSAYLATVRENLDVAQELNGLWEDGYSGLEIEALFDGDDIDPWESVLHITGDVSSFAHLETVYLGILARRTKIATRVRQVVAAARRKSVLFFPARFDHWAAQGGDGYAAHVGGAAGVSTDAQAEWWGGRASGTVPHALIAALGGDTVHAVRLFGESYPDVNLVALVDFDNDCVGTALKCAEALGDKLWGVRLDTAETMVDRSMIPVMGRIKPTGVVPPLVDMTRQALDRHGFPNVKIVVSGGFTAERIVEFEALGIPVDAYGVGSSLIQGAIDFTADIVRPCAKAGRAYSPNPRLRRVD